MTTRLVKLISIAAGLGTLAIMLYSSDPGSWALVPALMLFGLWALLPYALLYTFARRIKGVRRGPLALLAVALVTSALGLAIYIDGFFIAPDPQSGLLFIFIPVYQLVVAGVLGGLSMTIRT
jgi:hypothetical protein